MVPGGADGRLEALEAVNAAMRSWGWKTEKLAYELRKLFVSQVYNEHSLAYASEYSGDNATTIEQFYARAYRRDAPEVKAEYAVASVTNAKN